MEWKTGSEWQRQCTVSIIALIVAEEKTRFEPIRNESIFGENVKVWQLLLMAKLTNRDTSICTL